MCNFWPTYHSNFMFKKKTIFSVSSTYNYNPTFGMQCVSKFTQIQMVSKCQLSILLLEGNYMIKRQMYSEPFTL